MFWILVGEIYERNLFNATFHNTRTGERYEATYGMLLQYILSRHLGLFVVWLFCVIMDIAIAAFFFYHLFLIAKGQTTNETFKWSAARRVYRKMTYAYKQHLESIKLRPHSADAAGIISGCENIVESSSHDDVLIEGGEKEKGGSIKREGRNKKTRRSEGMALAVSKSVQANDHLKIGCTPGGLGLSNIAEPPIQAAEEEKDKEKEKVKEVGQREYGGEIDMNRGFIVTEDPGPFPKNLYNQGFFRNLR